MSVTTRQQRQYHMSYGLLLWPHVLGLLSLTLSTTSLAFSLRRRGISLAALPRPKADERSRNQPLPKKSPAKSPQGKDLSAQSSQSQSMSKTLGQIIQDFSSFSSPHLLLAITSPHIWLPTDSNLPSHYKQFIHHEKRKRWASLLVEKLGCDCIFPQNESSLNIWRNETLSRVVLAAALPYPVNNSTTSSTQLDKKEIQYIQSTLLGLHALAGKTWTENMKPDSIHHMILQGILLLIQKAEESHSSYTYLWTLDQIIQVRWAIRGIISRILEFSPSQGNPFVQDILKTKTPHPNHDTLFHRETRGLLLAHILPSMEKRVSNIPFDILPCGIDWTTITATNHMNHTLHKLQQQIHFQLDNIITTSGSSVMERRSTAWVAEDGIGALAYSGKMMEPYPIPPLVSTTMRLVEEAVFQNFAQDVAYDNSFSAAQLCWEETGTFFDCSLCNFYMNGESACKFHTDPEHGTYWDRFTCVVSAGEERKFAFRPIPGKNLWSQWDSIKKQDFGFIYFRVILLGCMVDVITYSTTPYIRQRRGIIRG